MRCSVCFTADCSILHAPLSRFETAFATRITSIYAKKSRHLKWENEDVTIYGYSDLNMPRVQTVLPRPGMIDMDIT